MGDHADDAAALAQCYEVYEEQLYDNLEKGVWTTKNGDEIKITDMADSHLLNTINYLDNKMADGIMLCFREAMLDEAIKRGLHS